MTVLDFLKRQISPADLEEVGIGGFTTMARISDTTEYSAQAPVTYLENGEFASDHIIIDPIILTLEGQVSRRYIAKPPSSIIRDRIAETIGEFNQFLPERTGTEVQKILRIADQANDRIRNIDSLISSGRNISRFLGNQDIAAQDNRTRFVEHIRALMQSKQLISIEMSTKTFKNMFVTFFSETKDNQTDSLLFKIKAQEVRFAQTFFSEISDLKFKPAEGLNGQVEDKTEKGVQKGKETPTSILSFIFG